MAYMASLFLCKKNNYADTDRRAIPQWHTG